MVYLMSDIHGEYDKYISMLKAINFKDEDVLYILGDVLDRGPEPIKVLKDTSMRHNVYPIIGNHEIMAIDVLEELLVEVTEGNYDKHINENIINKLIEWQQNGGDITLSQFKNLSNEERFYLIDYLREFAPYEVIDINNKTYILVHSGLGNYKKSKALKEYSLEELAFSRPNYDKQLFDDTSIYIVSGHTPTLSITGKSKIYHQNNNICIDCGATFGGKLACLRLDDMKEFYT